MQLAAATAPPFHLLSLGAWLCMTMVSHTQSTRQAVLQSCKGTCARGLPARVGCAQDYGSATMAWPTPYLNPLSTRPDYGRGAKCKHHTVRTMRHYVAGRAGSNKIITSLPSTTNPPHRILQPSSSSLSYHMRPLLRSCLANPQLWGNELARGARGVRSRDGGGPAAAPYPSWPAEGLQPPAHQVESHPTRWRMQRPASSRVGRLQGPAGEGRVWMGGM